MRRLAVGSRDPVWAWGLAPLPAAAAALLPIAGLAEFRLVTWALAAGYLAAFWVTWAARWPALPSAGALGPAAAVAVGLAGSAVLEPVAAFAAAAGVAGAALGNLVAARLHEAKRRAGDGSAGEASPDPAPGVGDPRVRRVGILLAVVGPLVLVGVGGAAQLLGARTWVVGVAALTGLALLTLGGALQQAARREGRLTPLALAGVVLMAGLDVGLLAWGLPGGLFADPEPGRTETGRHEYLPLANASFAGEVPMGVERIGLDPTFDGPPQRAPPETDRTWIRVQADGLRTALVVDGAERGEVAPGDWVEVDVPADATWTLRARAQVGDLEARPWTAEVRYERLWQVTCVTEIPPAGVGEPGGDAVADGRDPGPCRGTESWAPA